MPKQGIENGNYWKANLRVYAEIDAFHTLSRLRRELLELKEVAGCRMDECYQEQARVLQEKIIAASSRLRDGY